MLDYIETKKILDQIAEKINKAKILRQQNYYDDCASNCRNALEIISNYLYDGDPKEKTLFEKIDAISHKLPVDIYDKFHEVRIIGNKGSHPTEYVTEEEAFIAYSDIVDIFDWFLKEIKRFLKEESIEKESISDKKESISDKKESISDKKVSISDLRNLPFLIINIILSPIVFLILQKCYNFSELVWVIIMILVIPLSLLINGFLPLVAFGTVAFLIYNDPASALSVAGISFIFAFGLAHIETQKTYDKFEELLLSILVSFLIVLFVWLIIWFFFDLSFWLGFLAIIPALLSLTAILGTIFNKIIS